MRPFHGFIISIFLTAFAAPFFATAQSTNCRKLDVSVEVTHTQNQQPGSITVKVANAGVEFTLHLLGSGPSTRHEQLKIEGGTINNIPAGKYDLVIHATDGAYCSETRKVTIN